MPKLWNETIDAHRAAVRDAVLDTTAAMVADQGLLSVTMSQIAEETGIGRATLYKYFSDVEAILLAWHERQISAHLEYLAQVRDQASGAGGRLKAVLEAFALISYDSRGHRDTEFAAFLHRDDQVSQAQHKLHNMIRDLLTEGAKSSDLRHDVAPDELASYCLYALAAASSLPTKAAVLRLVSVTLAGLQSGTGAQPAAAQEGGSGELAAGGPETHENRIGAAGPHSRPAHREAS
jgi:AcrR family transcriptional regulator